MHFDNDPSFHQRGGKNEGQTRGLGTKETSKFSLRLCLMPSLTEEDRDVTFWSDLLSPPRSETSDEAIQEEGASSLEEEEEQEEMDEAVKGTEIEGYPIDPLISDP